MAELPICPPKLVVNEEGEAQPVNCSNCPPISEIVTFAVENSVGVASEAVDSVLGQYRFLQQKLMEFEGVSLESNVEQLLQEAFALVDVNFPVIPSLSDISGCPMADCILPNSGIASAIQDAWKDLGVESLANKAVNNLATVQNTVMGKLAGLQEAMASQISIVTDGISSIADTVDKYNPLLDCIDAACPDNAAIGDIARHEAAKARLQEAAILEIPGLTGDAVFDAAIGQMNELKGCLRDQIDYTVGLDLRV